MANDVVIEVEARVGDAIAQMTLTAGAVRMLADEADNAGGVIGDSTDRRSLSGRLSGLRATLSNMGDRGPLGMVVRGFGNLASAMLGPLDLGTKIAGNFSQLGTVGQSLIGVVATLTIGWVGFAAAVAVVTFAATALATILGTLVAIVADLVAPVTLVAGLLGSLAAGFVIGAKRAAEGGGKLNAFSRELDKLQSMFGKTSNILAHVFLPYLMELGNAAEHALTFLDRIIKLPLGQAFRAIDTRGTKLLGQFVDRVAQVLSKPIRLAFRVAFDDTAFSNMVSDWWHRFTGFLFGYTETHQVHIGKFLGPVTKTEVDGIFQPVIDWFNRHHFTKQGIGIGKQIIAGILDSGMRKRIGDFISQVFRDSARRAGRAFLNMLEQPLGPLLLRIVVATWNKIDKAVNDAGHQARNAIVSWMGQAWEWVKTKAHNIWNAIVDFVTKPFSISIDWPSPPSWLTSLLGGGGPSVPGRGGSGGSSPTGNKVAVARVRPAMAMASPNVTVNVYGADLSDGPTQKRIAQKLGKAIVNDWRTRAGGH